MSQPTLDLRIHQPNNFQFDSIPDSHDWSEIADHPSVDSTGSDSVPVIDLDDPKLIEKIGKACEEWGVFLIQHHGVALELLNRVTEQAHRLFALPVEAKLRAAKHEGHGSGYGGVAISHLFSKYMWFEGFVIPTGSPLDHAKKLWPVDYSSFCEVIEEYKRVIHPLGFRLIHLMLLSLGLTEQEIDSTLLLGDTRNIKTSMHLNSYPACPEPDRVVGLAPHTDTAIAAIIHHNGVSGLQVLRREDDTGPTRWVTVPVIPNTLVVIIGDLMHVLSNGRFHNVTHRCTVSKTDQRLSAANFFGPQAYLKIGPVSKLTGPKQKPLYRPVTWPELQKIKGAHYDKVLQSLKIDDKGTEGADCAVMK